MFLLSINIQKDLERLGQKYEMLLGGDCTVDDFWKDLFPFINNLLNNNGQTYRGYREKMGKVYTDSLNRILINLRDKKQSYRESMDIGDNRQASLEQKLFISISKDLMKKLYEVLDFTTGNNTENPSTQTLANGELLDNSVIPKNEKNSDPKGDNGFLFISYAREDFEHAHRLYNDLKSAGLNPWLDKEELLPGQNYDKEIRNSVRKSRFFLPVFSSASVAKRGYIQREFKLGLETLEEIPEDQVFVIPVKIDNCQIPFEKLSKIHYQDMFPDWNKGVEKIIKVIKNNL